MTGKAILVGVVAGLFSGLLGVGGGVIMVPLLAGWMAIDQHDSHATSLAAILVIALAGVFTFAGSGAVDLSLGISLGIGGVVGSTFGAHTMNRLSPSTLRLIFGGILILAGIRMVM